ncbi:MAG: hypothetical protein V2A73_12205 [Pseudomonadota bacterium]
MACNYRYFAPAMAEHARALVEPVEGEDVMERLAGVLRKAAPVGNPAAIAADLREALL